MDTSATGLQCLCANIVITHSYPPLENPPPDPSAKPSRLSTKASSLGDLSPAFLIVPASITVHRAEDAGVHTLGDDCFDLICKSCGDRFHLIVRAESAQVQKRGRDSAAKTVPSCCDRLPIRLRQFIVFNPIWEPPLEGFEGNAEWTESEDDNRLDGIVGSYEMRALANALDVS
jgi:hypothetical protein